MSRFTEFKVLGLPKPQARPRAVSRGKFVKVYSPGTEWKESVKYAATKQPKITLIVLLKQISLTVLQQSC